MTYPLSVLGAAYLVLPFDIGICGKKHANSCRVYVVDLDVWGFAPFPIP